jgi:hypothetical protein
MCRGSAPSRGPGGEDPGHDDGIVCPLPGMKPHWVLGIAPGVLSMCLSSRSAKMRSKVFAEVAC